MPLPTEYENGNGLVLVIRHESDDRIRYLDINKRKEYFCSRRKFLNLIRRSKAKSVKPSPKKLRYGYRKTNKHIQKK